jgi:pimeloyl-ACP methyl ester carboxylesterase
MRPGAALVVAVAVAACAACADARATTLPCAPGVSQCIRVTVPLNRAGGGGSISLHAQRVPAAAPGAGTLIVLPGGPGQSGSASLRELVEALGPAVRRRWSIVTIDPRGAGRSGVLLCPALQADPTLRSATAAAECARRLGGRRTHYTAADQIQDVEAVRASLGVERVAVYGTSYGTRIALGYAAAFPQHVDRVILDSVVPPGSPAGVAPETYAAIRRVLASLCPRRCQGVTTDLVAETTALVAQLRLRPLLGTVYDAGGRGRRASIDAVGLLDLIFDGDRDPALRGGLAAAITFARRGDPAELLRLAAAGRVRRLLSPGEFSAGMYAATNCTELSPPWDPLSPPAVRRAQLAASLDAAGDAPFAPFDRQIAAMAGLASLCLEWPTDVPPPTPVPPQPLTAPTLVLAGSDDVRTPLENGRLVAASLPNASVLVVPSAGHSVFAAGPDSCAAQAVVRFLVAARRPAPCRGVSLPTPPALAPSTPESLRPVGSLRGARGRTLRALELTLDDVAFGLQLSRTGRGGGLRGGSFERGARWPRLRAVQYVPGVRISGRSDARGRLVLHILGRAASPGTLLVSRDGRVRGRLAGRRVAARLKPRDPDLG